MADALTMRAMASGGIFGNDAAMISDAAAAAIDPPLDRDWETPDLGETGNVSNQ